jgi:hypothetical protein
VVEHLPRNSVTKGSIHATATDTEENERAKGQLSMIGFGILGVGHYSVYPRSLVIYLMQNGQTLQLFNGGKSLKKRGKAYSKWQLISLM